MLFCLIAMLALTRAEIVQRMRTPVITQADGLVRVFANCPEDMRREFQGPIASFASDAVTLLYRAEQKKSSRFESPRIIVHIGDVRTNVTTVVARASTNDNEVITRIYLKSPSGADLNKFRVELTRAFYRAVCGRELSETAAVEALRKAQPGYAFAVRRDKLEAWLKGDRSKQGFVDDETWDEEHLTLLRKVIEIGVSTRRDLRTFASRLYIYPPYFSEPFAGGRRSLSFREAIEFAERDARVPVLALRKAMEISVYGSGRSEQLGVATRAYVDFLKELGRGDADREELEGLLLNAEKRMELAWENAK